MVTGNIDFNEELVLSTYPEILDILLLDRSSNKNVKWCTDNYHHAKIHSNDFMTKESLFYNGEPLIKPRILKSQTEQKKRIKDMAEVFTPSWACNKQNNLVDNEWFGYVGAFNSESGKKWTTKKSVKFQKGRTWQEYVDLERMEITCGEAPYLTSRYDTTDGSFIAPKERIGLLDRKLRVISENVDDKNEWYSWAKIAYQRIYGYEWQGDNLLIARENLLMTFIEFYIDKFGEKPTREWVLEIAEIISWNLWQMDGLKYVIPDSCHEEETVSLFDDIELEPDFCRGCKTGDNHYHNGIYCYIKDWKIDKKIRFIDVVDGGIRYA